MPASNTEVSSPEVSSSGISSLHQDSNGSLLESLIHLGMADRKLCRRIEMNKAANDGKQVPCPLSATPDPSLYFADNKLPDSKLLPKQVCPQTGGSNPEDPAPGSRHD